MNLDLYGYCPREDVVAVVQIRHAFRQRASHYLATHKDYVLCGFNEITREPFRQPVSEQAVRKAISKDAQDPAVSYQSGRRSAGCGG